MTKEDDPEVIGKTNTFKGAYRRGYKREHEVNEKTKFRDLLKTFSSWATSKWGGTRKQIKALAVEGRLDGVKTAIIEESYRKDGKEKSRYRDIFSGSFRSKSDYETDTYKEIKFYRDEKGRYISKK